MWLKILHKIGLTNLSDEQVTHYIRLSKNKKESPFQKVAEDLEREYVKRALTSDNREKSYYTELFRHSLYGLLGFFALLVTILIWSGRSIAFAIAIGLGMCFMLVCIALVAYWKLGISDFFRKLLIPNQSLKEVPSQEGQKEGTKGQI